MKTIQVTIDERPVKVVDKMSRARNPTRSGFICNALEAEIQRQQIRKDETRHTEGCTCKLVTLSELDVWLKGIAESFGLGFDDD